LTIKSKLISPQSFHPNLHHHALPMMRRRHMRKYKDLPFVHVGGNSHTSILGGKTSSYIFFNLAAKATRLADSAVACLFSSSLPLLPFVKKLRALRASA
jgi:hypothetical protein